MADDGPHATDEELEVVRQEDRSRLEEVRREGEETGWTTSKGGRGDAEEGPGPARPVEEDDTNWWNGSALARELRDPSSQTTEPSREEPVRSRAQDAEGAAVTQVFALPGLVGKREPGGEGEKAEPAPSNRAGESREETGYREATAPLSESTAAGHEGVLRKAAVADPGATPGSGSAVRTSGPRHRRDATRPVGETSKLGVVGGKRTGKSYLFQSMVYRTYSGIRSGALSYYLDRDAVHLSSTEDLAERYEPLNIKEFVENYAAWRRLEFTPAEVWRWYRLCLNYRTGILGRRRGFLEVEFFDAAGESFFQRAMAPENRTLWQNFADARVMVFCLPLWTAFPRDGLTTDDHQQRGDHLRDFEQVVDHYRVLRQGLERQGPVRSILALTMADDPRGSLETLRRSWIASYMDQPGPVLRSLRTGAGTARYLANARRVSEALHVELEEASDPTVSRIPALLDFDGGRPWLMPISAIEGSRLDLLELLPYEERPMRLPPPVPVHAELPLLVALCERTNALM